MKVGDLVKPNKGNPVLKIGIIIRTHNNTYFNVWWHRHADVEWHKWNTLEVINEV